VSRLKSGELFQARPHSELSAAAQETALAAFG